MAEQSEQALAGLDVPHLDGAIVAAARQSISGRDESERAHRTRVTFERPSAHVAVQVPNLDGLVD